MQGAKAVGIDAFALNFGPDTGSANYTQQLVYAYESAANNDMKVFLSFDFNDGQWPTTDAAAVGAKIAAFGSHEAQLKVDDKAFVSTFVGDALDVSAMRAAAGIDVYFAPNFNPGSGADFSALDGAFSWYGWPTDGSNNPPSSSSTYLPTYADNDYTAKLGGDKSKYVAPVSPWFFTHFQDTSSFAGKNWLFPADTLWFTRWNEILALGPRFVEIITWNDYGESHYISPLSSRHYDDGSSKWANDMPHSGWASIAAAYALAYKSGATSVTAAHVAASGGDRIVYWYRPQPKGLDCTATDNVGEPPAGAAQVADSVFVVALLGAPATVEVVSGGNAAVSREVGAGASVVEVPLAVGGQGFRVLRDGVVVLEGESEKAVSGTCVCGLYNFNAYVGTLPAPTSVDRLDADGLSRFTEGLKVTTCSPTPTLGAKARRV
ncbi:Glucan endo-1,3-alpha-glucosidase agn1 [Diplodia seriata]|uniref:Glucan endo-1,3-alpha-glucosidase agn1 n=1 Tax=Diplodia seriata TaxID=420778 RepID=A0A1S8B5L0_9PEZI|nr:Glucan endo-1,3-alpha-glucosidase agn1 [Diplodia seriata]